MAIHFEELWEACELFNKDKKDETISSLIDELEYKIALYKAIDKKKDIPKEEVIKIKSRTLGEILLSLTNISLIDEINVYDSLNQALQYRKVKK